MMSVFFVTHQMHLQATIFKRLLLRHLRRMHGSAALYRFTISNSACFSISDPAQVLLLRSTFGLFPHHFVEHFRGRCAQDVAFGKRLKLLAGLVLMFSLLENSSIHRNQVPIHFGLLCDMREELSDTKWQDCDPQSWSLWYDAKCYGLPLNICHGFVRWVSAPSVPLEECSFQQPQSPGVQAVADVVSLSPLDLSKGRSVSATSATSSFSDSIWWDRYM